MKTFEETLNKVQEIAEEKYWSVDIYEDGCNKETVNITFQKYSPHEQDFNFEISCNKNDDIDNIIDNIYEYYENFDVSYETYLWLDDTGHGKNGAPDDMIDVYHDMKWCKQSVYTLWKTLNDDENN